MTFVNAYEIPSLAEAYSKLDFPGTYYLAYRDIPGLVKKYITGSKALDFGCGAGRSTRFLRELGLNTIGIDISDEMLRIAKSVDPSGRYIRVDDGDISMIESEEFDLILSAFTFDNIPTRGKKIMLFSQMRSMLSDKGKIINLVSSPEIYTHEWASFTTKDFPENKQAVCGDIVKIINTAIEDRTPVEDIIWPEEDYRDIYREVGLCVVDKLEPKAVGDEPYEWINEMKIAPWNIYVLEKETLL